jgi:hypothetical protein
MAKEQCNVPELNMDRIAATALPGVPKCVLMEKPSFVRHYLD